MVVSELIAIFFANLNNTGMRAALVQVLLISKGGKKY
jgi:hypothetical protein